MVFDIVIDGMQGQGAFFGALPNPVVGEEVVDRQKDGAFFGETVPVVFGIGVIEVGDGGGSLFHPIGDVVFVCHRFGVQQAVNAAAVGVSHDDDVVHFQMFDAVLDGGHDGVGLPYGCLMRHDGGDVADDEEFARAAPQDDAGIDPRIAAGDDEGVRVLAFGKRREKFGVFGEHFTAKVVKSRDESVKIFHDVE